MEKIEGIPDGWRLVRIGYAKYGEYRIASSGDIECWGFISDCSKIVAPIIEKIEQPKRYRPFANAAEFEPHRDKWITRQHTPKRYKVIAFDDYGIYSADGRFFSYSHLFESGTVFVNGSRPFGVELTEA